MKSGRIYALRNASLGGRADARPMRPKTIDWRSEMTVQTTVRLPESMTARLDAMADRAGLTRAQLVRMLLARASEADLPVGLVENAERLREARGVAR